MLNAIDSYFLEKEEPQKSCMLALRRFILNYHKEMMEVWSYGMPFYNLKGKRFCYLWLDKKTGVPYLGIVDGNNANHPLLVAGKRSRMKVFYIDPEKNIPVKTIKEIFKAVIEH